jgi:hypothetical protein
MIVDFFRECQRERKVGGTFTIGTEEKGDKIVDVE